MHDDATTTSQPDDTAQIFAPTRTGMGAGTVIPGLLAAPEGELPGVSDSVRSKLTDAMTPGFQAEFDPDEAEAAGAFQEDALSEADAIGSTHD